MIRDATLHDSETLVALLDQLGYPDTASFITSRLTELLEHPDARVMVYEEKGRVVALLCTHFIPQLALLKPFLRISYFVVDEASRSHHIGAILEAHVEKLAKEKGCDRIEVHCHERRKNAYRFYARQGYVESPKYLIKML